MSTIGKNHEDYINLYIVFQQFLRDILLSISLTSQGKYFIYSEHTTSLLPIHQKISLHLMIRKEKIDNSSTDLLRKKSSPMNSALHKINTLMKSQKHNAILVANTLYWVVPSCALSHIFSVQLFSFTIAIAIVVHRHNLRAYCLRCTWHLLLSVQSFLGGWQLFTQLIWGMHKPGSATELTHHGASLHQWNQELVDKSSPLSSSGRKLYLASQKVRMGAHPSCP